MKYYFFFLAFFLLTSMTFSQTTYKVACDKTDNTVKVIKSDNRSPNYVPIKGGFPFRQIAERWIDENYNTTVCNPGEIIKQIQADEKQLEQVQSPKPKQPAVPAVAEALGARPKSSMPKPKFKNTSFVLNGKFSNLGKAFNLKSTIAPGFRIGFEQLFGQKTYLGIGFGMNFYFSDVEDFGTLTFYSGKFPIFIGHRVYKGNLIIAYEFGAEFNTVIQEDGSDGFDFNGLIPNKNSTNGLARFKVGSNKVMGMLGAEFGVTEVFENSSYKMSAFYLGIQFNL